MGSTKHLEGSSTLYNEVEGPPRHSRCTQSVLDTRRRIFHNYHSAQCSPCSSLVVMEMYQLTEKDMCLNKSINSIQY